MGRSLSVERRDQIKSAHKKAAMALGPALGVIVLRGNIPIPAVAELLAVSQPTVYRWMYGQTKPQDKDKIDKIGRLLTVLRKAERSKEMPLYGTVAMRTEKLAALIKKHRPALHRSE